MGRCEYCKKATTKKGKTWDPITFHRFPSNQIERKKWTKNLGRPDWEPAKTAVLCSEHFTSDCFERWFNITRIRKGSVPTIFQRDTSATHKNSDNNQVLHKKPKVDISMLPTKDSTSLPPNDSRCAETSNPAKEIFHPMSDSEISVPSPSLSTTKPSRRNPLTPRTSRLKASIKHDHHYENTPRTSKKQIHMQKKYQKRVKALQRKVKSLKIRVSSLQQVLGTLAKKKWFPNPYHTYCPPSTTQHSHCLQEC